MSLARKHFQKTMAAKQAAANNESPVRANASQYEMMQAQLHAHRQELSGVQSIILKCKKKREFIPLYLPYIEGVLESGDGQTDIVLMMIMLWSIDAGQYTVAIKIAAYAISHQLSMPDTHQRSTACVIAEELADAALKTDTDAPVSLLQITQTYQLLADQDYPDQVKAKLEKALAIAYQEDNQLSLALTHFRTALSLNNRAGVKPLIKSLEKQIKETNKPNTEANPS